MRFPILLLTIPLLCCISTHADSIPPTVAELLEDNGEALMQQLGTQGGGVGALETRDIFSGKSAVKITPMQLFQRAIPGWK